MKKPSKVENIENIVNITDLLKDNSYMKTLEKLSWYVQMDNKFKGYDLANTIMICRLVKNIMQYLDKDKIC